MSVTLPPARVAVLPLWTRIVSALAVWMSTVWVRSRYTMWAAELVLPEVMAAGDTDSKPTHVIKLLGVCNKLT